MESCWPCFANTSGLLSTFYWVIYQCESVHTFLKWNHLFITHSFYITFHFMSKALKSLPLLLQRQNNSFRRITVTLFILNPQSTPSGAFHCFLKLSSGYFFFPQGHLTKGYVDNELFQNLRNSSSLQKENYIAAGGKRQKKMETLGRISCGSEFLAGVQITHTIVLWRVKRHSLKCVLQVKLFNVILTEKEKRNLPTILTYLVLFHWKHNWE